MEILFTDEIKDTLLRELETARDSVQIVTAYCKQNALEVINAHVGTSVINKRLLVRFRLDDILKGATDFLIYKFCEENQWDLFIRFDLHAKTYIIDRQRCIIGSANLTNIGLQLSKYTNYEIATIGTLSVEDFKKIDMLFEGAIHVTKAIALQLEMELKNVKNKFEFPSDKSFEWSNNIKQLEIRIVRTVFSYEFPDSDSLERHNGEYIAFLGMLRESKFDQIKEAFRACNAYQWLISILTNNNEIYFGMLAQALHNSLIEDPKPFRKDVKGLLANLLGWTEDLRMEEIIIDRPGHSQRVRLVNKYQ